MDRDEIAGEILDKLVYKLDYLASLIELDIALGKKLDINEIKDYAVISVDFKDAILEYNKNRYGIIDPYVLSEESKNRPESPEERVKELRAERDKYIKRFCNIDKDNDKSRNHNA